MSVTSVNGQTGVVVLDAAEVGAIPTSAKGTENGVATLEGKALAKEQLPSSVVSRTALATSGSVLDILTLYPEDFGATPTGDSTKAFQELIDHISTNGLTARVRLGPSYELLSEPRTDRQGNAVLALPKYGEASGSYIQFECAVGGTTFTGTQTGLAYDEKHGCPSLIGGPTPEQLGFGEGGNGSHFSSCSFEIFGELRVLLPNNPTICGLDLSRMPHAEHDRILIKAINPETDEPEHKWAFGVRLPEGDNGGKVNINRIVVEKMYAGMVGNSAHMNIKELDLANNVLHLGITGNEQDSGNDGHGSIINYASMAHAQYTIGSWSATEGATSLPTGKPAKLVINLLDIEDLEEGWQKPIQHILDGNNELHGCANYVRVIGNVGPVSGLLKASGARNFGRIDRTRPDYQDSPNASNCTTGFKAGAAFTSGESNSLFGVQAGEGITTGQNNTIAGAFAGSSLTTTGSNTFIGFSAGSENAGSKNVFIGAEAGKKETGSSKLYVSNSSTSNPLIFGDFEAKTLMVYGELKATSLGAGLVNSVALASEAVEEAKIKNKAVSSAKLAAPTTKPAKAAENAVTVAAASPTQKRVGTYTGNGSETKAKVKHELGTRLVNVSVQRAAAEEPGEPLLNAAGAGNFTWKLINSNEVEIVFGAAPAKGEQFYVTIMG